ncbi:MAG: YdcF family protein [Methylocystis sp.]|nr:YdcF family protein [Methylocystis sp.]MBI3275461.1 YdcF family protein [Methylocystis sp.]
MPRFVSLAALCALCFAVAALLVGFVGFARSLERAETTLAVKADGVVALTGGSYRVQEAVELLARGQAHRLLITGVNRSTRGYDLKRLLPVPRDLFACCVDLGYQALDTAGNAAETRDWAKAHDIAGSLIVVTSNYHMPRALVELSAALPGVTLYPFAVVSERVRVEDWASDMTVARLVGAEYMKYLLAVARTRLLDPVISADEAPPAPRAAPDWR